VDGEPYAVFVEIAVAERDALMRKVPLWCRSISEGTFTVVSDVVGTVSEVRRREGEWVGKGDTLFVISRGPAYGDAPILAPASGRISIVLASEGSPVAVGTPLAVISRGRSVRVDMVIPEVLIDSVKVGSKVMFGKGSGSVAWISGVPVRDAGGYVARAYVRGTRPGRMGICDVVLAISDTLVVVPEKAVYEGHVFKVEGGRAHRVPVDVVFADGRGKVGVKGEIGAGDTIVVLGMESLREGDRVVF